MRTSFRVERSPRASLARHVSAVWIQRTDRADPLLPEPVVELVWSGRGLFVRGADTRAHCVSAFPEQTFVAVRFRPGSAVDVLGLAGRELADARVGISALWGRAEMERLESQLAAATPAEAAVLLEDAVERRIRGLPDPTIEAIVRLLGQRASDVRSLADHIGLSERQVLRRCVRSLGYGPKTLHRILRFQRFLGLARTWGHELAVLAVEAGYADQPHLTRECVRLGAATPATLLTRLEGSVSFKTRAAHQP